MKTCVSIIIPVYNGATWLAESIRSALAQNHFPKEVIVVDDGSTDQSSDIARSFLKDGVKVIAQPNRGASAARNAGLGVASGDFIQFLDADDLLGADKIARQIAALGDRHDRIAAGAWGVFSHSTETAVFTPESSWKSLPPVDWLVEIWSQGSMMQPGAWLTPRPLLDAAGPWNEALSLDDDGEYFARVVLASAGVEFVRDAFSYYRRHDGPRLSGIRGEKAWRSSFLSCESKERHLLAREDSPRTRHACANNYARFTWEHFPEGKRFVSRAEKRWMELGPTVRPPRGGGREAMVAHLLGWRLARRLQKLSLRMR